MGQIVGGAAKPKRCNLNKLSQWGTPAAGEYIFVSSDNSMNAAGQGNFDCYIEGDGRTAAEDLPLLPTNDGVYDISARHSGATYVDLAAALGTNGANVPVGVRRGGMSVKFVQSSDNKYVQYRLMADSWSIDTEDWAIDDEGVYVENPEFIYVKTDAENKILYGVKKSGNFYFGAGVPFQIQEKLDNKADLSKVAEVAANKVDKEEGKSLIDAEYASSQSAINKPKYLQVTTDSEDKILEGITSEGTKQINLPIDTPSAIIEHIKNPEYIDVTVDSDDRIIEGISKDGKKIISDFDESTRSLIRQIANDGDLPNKISIPLLDANFVSPIPCIIDGTKGDDDAKYSFTLPLQNEAYNIRFKFKITENILNQNKTSIIAKFGGTNAVIATPVKLNQLLTSSTYQGEEKMMYWPSLKGGIRLNGSSVERTINSGGEQNIGNFAFYVKYTGESTNVTIENTGQALIIKVDGVTTNLLFSDYQSVAELYEAVKSLSDFEVSYNELETRQCSELATFSECVLVSKYYTGVNGDKNDPIVEYYDTAPFFIPYAVSENWHQVEIVKIRENVYACVDGITITITPNDNILSLGGECGCLFKELEVDTISSSDAEFIDGVLISSVNPNIIIHEGHEIIQTPTNEIVSPSENLGTTVDRLQLVYSKMIGKGYVPVSIDEIADYYAGNRSLPKRCFTSIFDDYRWVNCLDLSNRAVFTRLGIKPGLAIITSDQSPIKHNGSTITPQEAATICRHYQFGLYSHTRSHRDNMNIKPSTYFSELTADVYDGDIKGIDNSILVYPFGHVYIYMTDVMKWLGFRLGINIMRNGVNIKNRSKFNLTRIEIGVRENITDIFNSII